MITSIFFFNDTATTEIYTLSLHDALPISLWICCGFLPRHFVPLCEIPLLFPPLSPHFEITSSVLPAFFSQDRKSTRLNSSHANISYAVFCLKKKKTYMLHQHISYSHNKSD